MGGNIAGPASRYQPPPTCGSRQRRHGRRHEACVVVALILVTIPSELSSGRGCEGPLNIQVRLGSRNSKVFTNPGIAMENMIALPLTNPQVCLAGKMTSSLSSLSSLSYIARSEDWTEGTLAATLTQRGLDCLQEIRGK